MGGHKWKMFIPLLGHGFYCELQCCFFPFLKEYQSIVDAEWKILYEKLDSISQSGAKVVLSKLPIGDVATQYFADR